MCGGLLIIKLKSFSYILIYVGLLIRCIPLLLSHDRYTSWLLFLYAFIIITSAKHYPQNEQPPMPNPADILKSPTLCMCDPIKKGEFEYICEHGARF